MDGLPDFKHRPFPSYNMKLYVWITLRLVRASETVSSYEKQLFSFSSCWRFFDRFLVVVCVLGFLKVMIYKGFLVYFVSISGLVKITLNLNPVLPKPSKL